MKTIANSAMGMAVIAAAAMLTGCSQDQTAFDVNQVPDHAVVMGTVTYNEGTTYENGQFFYNYQPAANLPVIITIENGKYDGNLTGNTRFETTTDENGKYSLEIPVPDASATVRVLTGEFQGVHRSVQINNNTVQTVEDNVVYGGAANATVQPYGYVYADVVCTEKSKEQIAAGFTEYASFTAVIGQGGERSNGVITEKDSNTGLLQVVKAPWVDYFYTPATSVDVLVKVTTSNITSYYNATTNAQGEFTLNVPVKEFPATFDYEVTCLPKQANFTHYYAAKKDWTIAELSKYYDDPDENYPAPYTYIYKSVELKGFYNQNAQINGTASYTISAVTRKIESKALVFTPFEGQETEGYSTALFNNAPWLADLDAAEEN